MNKKWKILKGSYIWAWTVGYMDIRTELYDQIVKPVVSGNLGQFWHGTLLTQEYYWHSRYKNIKDLHLIMKTIATIQKDLASKEQIASKDGYRRICLFYQTQSSWIFVVVHNRHCRWSGRFPQNGLLFWANSLFALFIMTISLLSYAMRG